MKTTDNKNVNTREDGSPQTQSPKKDTPMEPKVEPKALPKEEPVEQTKTEPSTGQSEENSKL